MEAEVDYIERWVRVLEPVLSNGMKQCIEQRAPNPFVFLESKFYAAAMHSYSSSPAEQFEAMEFRMREFTKTISGLERSTDPDKERAKEENDRLVRSLWAFICSATEAVNETRRSIEQLRPEDASLSSTLRSEKMPSLFTSSGYSSGCSSVASPSDATAGIAAAATAAAAISTQAEAEAQVAKTDAAASGAATERAAAAEAEAAKAKADALRAEAEAAAAKAAVEEERVRAAASASRAEAAAAATKAAVVEERARTETAQRRVEELMKELEAARRAAAEVVAAGKGPSSDMREPIKPEPLEPEPLKPEPLKPEPVKPTATEAAEDPAHATSGSTRAEAEAEGEQLRVQLMGMTSSELEDILKEMELPLGGGREEIISRMVEAYVANESFLDNATASAAPSADAAAASSSCGGDEKTQLAVDGAAEASEADRTDIVRVDVNQLLDGHPFERDVVLHKQTAESILGLTLSIYADDVAHPRVRVVDAGSVAAMSGHFESMDIVTAINGAEMTSDQQARELISQSHGDIRFTVRRDGSRPPHRARWAVAMSSATEASSGEAGVAVAGVGPEGYDVLHVATTPHEAARDDPWVEEELFLLQRAVLVGVEAVELLLEERQQIFLKGPPDASKSGQLGALPAPATAALIEEFRDAHDQIEWPNEGAAQRRRASRIVVSRAGGE